MPRTKQRTDALHDRGVASALAVLAEDGVAGLTARSVARRADASVPAIYEVFGDKGGLIREVFFEGFRMLADDLSAVAASEDPLETLQRLAEAFRAFFLANPVLAQIMFSRPFADFDPTTEDDKAGARVREIFVRYVRIAVDAGTFVGNPTDIAHISLAMVIGLAEEESSGRLGTAKASLDRRWRVGVKALQQGFSNPVEDN
ncbi:TetR/AcrR family transcriptional regulator [Leifsonia sp. NPDC058292]|uniref:TetR/AcrR family transcriptional regulator n=1 Tax=Leifsonia sp. NPDC058292 TaxID=3346428 RepID=UPI0036DE5113